MYAEEIKALLDNQNNLGEQIVKIFVNFGKANAQQKSKLKYVTAKLQEVKQLFETFEDNAVRLNTLENKEHDYFKKGYCKEIQAAYVKYSSAMFDHQQKLIAELADNIEVSNHVT